MKNPSWPPLANQEEEQKCRIIIGAVRSFVSIMMMLFLLSFLAYQACGLNWK
ncbi:hypothetical protein IT412_03180, partial [Candidatus Peregrinibacteria bacterium]|nr:hypothetical protein [Candidatus Peregrinibacteria bacterium]